MKKIFFTATIALSGLFMLSCEADAIDSSTAQANDFGIQKKGLKVNITGSNYLSGTGTIMAADGPGDDVIIITPPKNP